LLGRSLRPSPDSSQRADVFVGPAGKASAGTWRCFMSLRSTWRFDRRVSIVPLPSTSAQTTRFLQLFRDAPNPGRPGRNATSPLI
jgi:hypothetical protein